MRVLYLHAKKFSYKPREPVKNVPRDNVETSKLEFENVLVVFTTIEKGDWNQRDEKIDELINDVSEHTKRVDVKKIVVYPYAHLSDNLEDPRYAIRFLKLLENRLREKFGDIHRAPFGWYKEFAIEVYGHPLSELSRRF